MTPIEGKRMPRHKEYLVDRKRKVRLPPIHPGAILREDVLPALGLSVSAAARQLRVSRQTLHRILAEKSSITSGMALRLGKFCGNGPDLWLNLQQEHGLWHAGKKMKKVIEKIPGPRRAARRGGPRMSC